MIDRTFSPIDLAFQQFDTPVGTLFCVTRHGRMKRCFSRNTAIRYLAFFMTSRAFERSGFRQRHDPAQIVHPVNPELNRWLDGAVTHEYYEAHGRCIRRLRRILARKQEMKRWCKKWDAMHDRYVQERNALQSCKPF